MHPFDNPSLPSFLNREYLEVQEDLQTVLDVWNGLKGRASIYVKKEHKEPISAYQERLSRCKFDNRFKPTISGYAGLLSSFTINEDTSASIFGFKDNIDNLGSDMPTFFGEADRMAMRDGWCGIVIDYPPQDSSIESQADFIQSNRRPYMVIIDRRDILNWNISYRANGRPFINEITIRERRTERVGDFGSKEETFYRVLSPGIYQVFQILSNDKGEHQLIKIEEGETSLETVPFVYYSLSEGKFFKANPPFQGLADLNIEHFQKRSQLNEVLRKCNLPVPVRRGLIRSVEDIKKVPPLVMGPNSFLDIPSEGDFFFAEPSGVAIAATQNDIEKLEAAMDRVSLSFISGGEAQRTATEVLLDAAQIDASLTGMAAKKQSNVQQCFEFWTAYTQENSIGGITVDDSILQLPIPPEQAGRLTELAQTGFIGQEALLSELKKGKALSKDFDIQREVKSSQSPQDTDF
jgi:Domain of unknown function (DUF4055)